MIQENAVAVIAEALTPHDCQRLLQLGRDSTYALLRSGELRSVRVGRRWLIPRDAITEFLARRT